MMRNLGDARVSRLPGERTKVVEIQRIGAKPAQLKVEIEVRGEHQDLLLAEAGDRGVCKAETRKLMRRWIASWIDTIDRT
jgi:hypothetical protein